MKLSIIIPVYNEKNTIVELLNRIEKEVDIEKEIIVIDDNSTDGSSELIKKYNFKSRHFYFKHIENRGKGACIKTAKQYVSGDIILIQDADLEYNPKDYNNLIKPIVSNVSKVVYGSRVLNKRRYYSKNFYSISRVFFNHILTILSNFLNNQNLTDAHTCYKVFDRNVFNNLKLEENDFSFCPEVTTKLSLAKINIIEIPIDYIGRTYIEGKKIKLIDGVKAIKTLLKYRFK